VLIIGAMDLGWYFFEYLTLSNIARKAARKASVGNTVQQITDLIMEQAVVKPDTVSVSVISKDGAALPQDSRNENDIVTVTLSIENPTLIIPLNSLLGLLGDGSNSSKGNVTKGLRVEYSCSVE
jgi:Flp pilus assembly protein TadG